MKQHDRPKDTDTALRDARDLSGRATDELTVELDRASRKAMEQADARSGEERAAGTATGSHAEQDELGEHDDGEAADDARE